VLGIYDKASDQHNLYLANASGGQLTLLTNLGSEGDFSPDGQWVVYFSYDSSHLGLRLIKTDGTGGTQLTNVEEHGYPTFSPDGSHISFCNYETDDLHVIKRDGTDLRTIGKGEYPAWSPVGDQIVYRGCVGGGKCGLIVANADGSSPRQITTHANDAAPRWSPNGGQIAFHSDRDGNWEIYVINSDGSWLRRITNDVHTDIMPVWSPDGLRIAFRSDRSGKGAVWMTSGIGGPAFKQFDADFDPDWPDLAQMDWAK
jgi:Tol biopolymer transport system component